MRNILLILGEIAVIVWLIVVCDYSFLLAWLPFIVYNVLFIEKIAEMFPLEWFTE